MSKKVHWGIIGTGAIARTFASALAQSRTGQLVAVASRSQQSADAFARQFAAEHAHGSYDALLRNSHVQAVYIATPHPFHAEWAIRAASAGKHLLVEKPIGVNHAQAMAIIEAAVENDVFLMEAFMYRCHPQTEKLLELIRQNAIGQVRIIQATFSFGGEFNPHSRLFSNDLAGGAILDVGCYPVSMARLIAAAEPIEVKGVAHLGQTGVDEWAAATLKFPDGTVAQLATAIRVQQDNDLRIFASHGQIIVPNPWMADRHNPQPGLIILQRQGQPPQEITVPAQTTSFVYEADLVGQAILSDRKQAPPPAMTRDDSLGNMRTLDLWRQSVGLVYDFEKPQGFSRLTIAGSPLRQRQDHNMKYGRMPGLDKPVSRLVMGCDNQRTLPHAAAMFDDFFQRGGNTFDTAWIYGRGLMEELLGQWLSLRGVRQQIVLIVKGAHTPLCTPRDIAWQLQQSLERLGTDYADVYLLHRDNPQVPAGEFIDALNEQADAGRIRVFGGSNWTLARVDQANAYAARTGRRPFAVVSNQFSLARMVDDPWGGCVSSSDPVSRRWFAEKQMPLLAWSSQAHGFFAPGRAAPDKLDNKHMVRCWYSDDNFQRLARAAELARKINATTINIALAYVLCQPFPTFALIGPRTLAETRTSLAALDLELTDEQLRWLNLEES